MLDYIDKHRIADEEIIKLIEEEYRLKNDVFLLLGREEKFRIVKNLKAIDGVTIRQLARIAGVSKYMVEKS